MNEITVYKQNLSGQVVFQYSGRVIRQHSGGVLIDALFNRDDMPFEGLILKRNDLFVEAYPTGRGYNIFEIHDRDDDKVKAWYCNICLPVVVQDGSVSFVDLALDLLVLPDGEARVLDEDEFEALEMEASTRQYALNAMRELKSIFPSDGNFHLSEWFESLA